MTKKQKRLCCFLSVCFIVSIFTFVAGFIAGSDVIHANSLLLDMCKTVFSPIAVVAFAGYLLFTLLDIATGLIKAFYLGDFQSAEMRKGLWKKTGTLCMVCVVIMLEAILCMLKFPGVPRYLTAIVSSWYMSMEVGSIIENLGVMGVPVPKILRRAIKAIKDKGDDMKSSEGENQHEEDNMH